MGGCVCQEEVAIGQYISMESSIGQGTRAVFESSLAEVLPSSTDAMALMDPKVGGIQPPKSHAGPFNVLGQSDYRHDRPAAIVLPVMESIAS